MLDIFLNKRLAHSLGLLVGASLCFTLAIWKHDNQLYLLGALFLMDAIVWFSAWGKAFNRKEAE